MAEGIVSEEKSLQEVPDKDMKCGGCTDSTDKAEAFCHQCVEFICKECVKSHKIMKPFATHQIDSFEDLKKHRVYDHMPSKTTSHANKNKLLEKLALLNPIAVTLSNVIERIQSIKQDTEEKEVFLVSQLESAFTELQLALNDRESEVLREVLRRLQDNKAVSMDAADMEIEVRCVESLQQLCQTNANITQLTEDPAQCTVRGEGVKTAEVNQTSEVILTAKTSSYKTSSSAVVVSQLKSLYDGSVIKCDVDQSGPSEYRIQYTPTVRGRHKLTVSVDRQQVAGSPFPVFVSIHPTQLGKPVKIWEDIDGASGITANTAGDIIVTEYEGDIVKLEADGKTSVLVTHSDSKLRHLESVSCDDEDNIYCTDDESNKIMKCNKNGGNVQMYEVEQVEGPGHWGVAVVRDEVMLCECDNEGTIMIYNRELKYVRRIEHSDGGEFKGISTNNHGNIYVTDSTNHCVHVFSNNGVFLRSFGSENNLDSPYYLCISCHYVYVTNYNGHYVSVFTTAGEYVTSFGQLGYGEGDFNGPSGVCTDKDGFLYVACYYNNRVQCF